MQILGGDWRGKHLTTPKGYTTRPTSGFVREAIFSTLSSLCPHAPQNLVLDLFAGSGALGFEALSRGYRNAYFIDMARTAQICLYENAHRLNAGTRAQIYRRDITNLRSRERISITAFELVFIDPPYQKGLVEPTLTHLAVGDWLVPSALIIVEEATRTQWQPPPFYVRRHYRDYDATAITILQYVPSDETQIAPARLA